MIDYTDEFRNLSFIGLLYLHFTLNKNVILDLNYVKIF